jgi:polynucleotide 5'-kinase involved in rRNA processing
MLNNRNDVINKVILQILTRKNKNNVLFHQPMMVYGQNGIGKSNFCCFLINKLLTLFNKVRWS